jgi:hypothetical protein
VAFRPLTGLGQTAIHGEVPIVRSVRQLPSGRWQVRYREPTTNRLVPAATTFATKREATNWLAAAETDMVRGAWVDPRAGRVDFTTFATAWLRDHPNLRARTRENYAGNLRNHIQPVIGALPLNQLSPNVIRRWHAELSRGGQLSPSTVAKCYRLVHAILETAVADELIVKNPCLVRGAAQDRSAERPIATLTEVLSLAEAVPPRYRALILTATFTGLRSGELLALRREDIDLLRRTVNVEQQLYELSDGTQDLGPRRRLLGVAWSRCRRRLSQSSSTISKPGPDLTAERSCSHRAKVGRYAVATSAHVSGSPPRATQASNDSASMISAIPATHWPQRQVRARVS